MKVILFFQWVCAKAFGSVTMEVRGWEEHFRKIGSKNVTTHWLFGGGQCVGEEGGLKKIGKCSSWVPGKREGTSS